MIIIHQPAVIRSYVGKLKKDGIRTGFVPTMGALHEGHIALVNEARRTTGKVIVSIFVNPTQFNDRSDYEKYPNRLTQDIKMLAAAGADLLFLPPVDAIYPMGMTSLELYNLGHLEEILEGKYRPGHFQGVCQVMSRLLNAIQPDSLYMGQKDYQQCMVVQKLIDLLQLNIAFVACPTLREEDGLAMSSRNLRLTEDERKKATHIYNALSYARNKWRSGSTEMLEAEGNEYLTSHGFRVDYFRIVSATDLQPLTHKNANTPVIALVAAYLGEVRLIDNMVLSD